MIAKLIKIEPIKSWHYSQGTAIFDYVPTEKGVTYYVYKPPIVSTHGPGVPDLEELDTYGYVAHYLCILVPVPYSERTAMPLNSDKIEVQGQRNGGSS